jgi:ATP-dependent Clp protease ATP-binding subunit ClpC
VSRAIFLRFPCFFRTDGAARHEGWPVLFPKLVGAGASPREALHRLTEQVRKEVREGELLLVRRLAAAPEDAEVVTIPLDVPWKSQRVSVAVRALRFERGGHLFTALPRIGALLPISAAVPLDERANATQAALDRWFRANRREVDAEREPWSDRGGDRILWVDAQVQPRWEGLDDSVESAFLQSLLGQEKVSGGRELEKVARRLDTLYPHQLRLDAVPDPRVGSLRRLLFEDKRPVPTVLVGPAGCGKTTLVTAAVRRHLDHAYATNPRQVHQVPWVHHLDPNRVIAGMSRLGAWERRFRAILEHLVSPDRGRPRDALFVDQPLALARAGRSAGSTLTLTTLLRPWVEDRRFPVVLEATPEAWVRLEELDRAFTDLFHVEHVAAPPRDRALAQILSQVEDIERSSLCTLTLSALRRVVELQDRFPAARGMPGGVIDRLEALAARNPETEIDAARVDATFQATSGLRPELVDPRAPLPDAALRTRVSTRLVGQPAAVDAIAELVHVLHAGLVRPGRPLAAWLLVGPTGVGKTEAAKVLAAQLFTTPELVRVDMNEYADPGAVSRLLGEGGVEGHLTARLRGRTVAVLLLDEVEKAHPSVHDLLLQVLDEGRLTDASGRVLDLSRVAVLLTSNVGAAEVARGAGFERGQSAREAGFRAAVERTFRPELVNRLDRVLVFRSLELADVRRVAGLQLERVLAREGLLRRTALLDVEPAALDRLAEAGFDPDLGARALKRLLEDRLVAGVAERLATIPLQTPIVLAVQASGDSIALEARPLRFAARLPALPDLPVPDAAAVETIRDRLPEARFEAQIGPEGTRVVGGHVLRLAHRLQVLAAGLEQEESTEIAEHLLARVHGRAARRQRPHRWMPPAPIDWMGVLSYRSVRAFLVEQRVEADAPPVDALELATLAMQVEAARRPHTVLTVSFEGVTEAEGLWALAAPYLGALADLLGELGIDVTRQRRGPTGWRDLRAPEGPERWQVEGPGARELLAFESGIHVFYPEEGSPVGLRVSTGENAGEEGVSVTHSATILRICPGRWTEDLATGLRTAEPRELLRQVWAARGRSHP